MRRLPQPVWLGVVLTLLSLPSMFAAHVVGAATQLGLTETTLDVSGALLVFGAVPVVTMSMCVLVLAPGLCLTLPFRGGWGGMSTWLVRSFAVSLVLVSVVSEGVEAVGVRFAPTSYAATLLAITWLCVGAATYVVSRRDVGALVAKERRDRAVLGLAAAVAGVACLVFAPKLLWEALNGDGAHAFEATRLLLWRALPYWPAESGPVSGFPGTTSMLFAFPGAWFMRLVGTHDYAVRAPFVLYLGILVAAIAAAARVGQPPDRRRAYLALPALVVGLGAFALAMAFSASYNPYSADLALPATQDSLLMVCFLGAVFASEAASLAWFAFFSALTYVSLPSGLILLAFYIMGAVLVVRPVPWRFARDRLAIVLGVAVTTALLARLATAFGATPPGGEYGLTGILRYFAFIQFTDASRLLYVLIPSGIFPALTMLAWPLLDRTARTLVVVCVAYFLFFFVQGYVSLHHFVPAMIVPMVVALRVAYRRRTTNWLGGLWLGCAVTAVILAMPERWRIHRDGRSVGAQVVERVGGYDEARPGPLHASTLLNQLFPFDWDPAVPDKAYGGSPLTWNRYAAHGGEIQARSNYLLQAAREPVPAGWLLVATDSSGVALYVRNKDVWKSDQRRAPETRTASPWLAVPRSTLFRSVPGGRVLDVTTILVRAGVDVDGMLGALGVQRRQ